MHTPASVQRYVRALAALAGFCTAFIAYAQAPEAVGATVEGNGGARDKAAQAAVGFLKMTFAH